MKARLLSVIAFALLIIGLDAASAANCTGITCEHPQVAAGPGALTAAYVSQQPGGSWAASNEAPADRPYTYALQRPCVVDDRDNGGCRPSDFQQCPQAPGRVVEDLIAEQRRLVMAGGRVADDEQGTYTPAPGTAVGTEVGPWVRLVRACIDITALNPPPSPDEVFRYFKTLPLPELTTHQQPPGNGLVGLPVIFFTDSPVTQTFTLDIRGFTVDIVAGATAFTWHTGDGADLTSADPGAPYPNQTVTHDYRSGTYTAYLTTTWGATFSVDGGASIAVPGTTTTDGPAVTFTVLQARPVLTDPYD
jgi:hypothetical protein